MSQWELMDGTKGKDYRQILTHYYQGTRIEKIESTLSKKTTIIDKVLSGFISKRAFFSHAEKRLFYF